MRLFTLLIAAAVSFGLFVFGLKTQAQTEAGQKVEMTQTVDLVNKDNLKTALLAGGCFWCLESDLDYLDGVEATISGYAGGSFDEPTYDNYYKAPDGETPHVEVVEVWYDPTKVDFEKIVHYYFRNIDPFDGSGQFYDRGPGYRPVIFYANEQEKTIAEAKRAEVEAMHDGRKTAVSIEPATAFWPAEDYHQDFYQKSPEHYKRYRKGSGRDQYIEKLWDGIE